MTLENYELGFWGLLTLYVVRDIIAPSVSKVFPSLVKASEREQTRLDRKQEFDNQMELRQVEALERIADFMGVANERLGHIESSLFPKRKSK